MTKDKALKLAFEALKDMNCGWKYIRESHGDLYGVGWDRAQQKADDASEALRQALEQPEQEVSYTDIQMAELIMSDCGHSSDYKRLLDRIAGRLAKYRQALKQPDPVEEAVLAEREACAKACESIRPSKQEYDQRFYTACTLCANAFRARGE